MYLSTDPKAYVDRCRSCDQTEEYWENLSTDSQRPVDRCRRQKCQSSMFWQNWLCLWPEQLEVCLLQICCNLSTDTQHLSIDAEDLQIRKPSFISKIVFSSPTTLHMKTQLYKHPFEENLVQKQPQPKTLEQVQDPKKLLLLCFRLLFRDREILRSSSSWK